MIRMSDLPVLAVCGWSGSGKTTLIEAVIPRLTDRGFRVAVVKHDAHSFDIDRPGKDSDRFFRAGATVALRSPRESVTRWHGETAPDLREVLTRLASRHDVVLVEGHKSTPLRKLWLLDEGETNPPAGLVEIVGTLRRESALEDQFLDSITEAMNRAEKRRKVIGGVLVGGLSKRMGQPKSLLEIAGKTLVERAVDALSDQVDEVILLGEGEVAGSLAQLPRIPDSPGLGGPVAGLLAALRWSPCATWLLTSCDLPLLEPGGIRWLIDQRKPGNWAVLPSVEGEAVEPLCAVYEPQSRHVVERMVGEGHWGLRRLVDEPTVATPVLPDELVPQWRGVNTPEEWEAFRRSAPPEQRKLIDS